MIETGWIAGAGKETGARIHAEFKPLAVDIISYIFHAVRKLGRVGDQLTFRAALP